MAQSRHPDVPTPLSPYKPGMGLEPPYLGDRQAQLERFREFLVDQTPHNVVVTGLRGVGKTVLLQRYRSEALEAGWLVADREFSEADAEPSMFAQRLLSDLTRLTRDLSLSRRLRDLASGAAERVTDFLGSLSVSYEGIELGYSPGRRPAKPRQMLDDDLRDAMREVGRLCQNSDHPGFILQYDEFHVVKEERGQLTLSALLSATAAVQREGLPIMLVLCGLPTILENLGQSKSYSERMFTVEQIGHLNPPEDRIALTGPAEARGRRFADDVVDAVMNDTLGYPYFIQLFGDVLWKGSDGKDAIDSDDFDRLRPRILDGLDHSFFESRYVRASTRERRVLKAIAAGGGESARIDELRARLQMSNSEVQPLVRFLVEKGLIYRPARGRIAFTAPMFGAYLRRRRDTD
jgi:hypothetical protein